MQQASIEKGRVKRILKSSASSSATVSDISRDTTDEYSRIMSKLTKFKKVSKETTKVNQRKVSWLTEQSVLQQSSSKVEKEIGQALQRILLASIGADDSSCIHSMIEDSTITQDERNSFQTGLWNQLQDLKAMLRGIVKAGEICPSSGGRELSSSSQLAKSIFADLLMSSFAAHSESGNRLAEQEKSLMDESKKILRYITTMLQSDRLDEQNRKLRADLNLREDEDAELELFVEDWLKKLAILDKGQQEALLLISAEYGHRCAAIGVDASDKTGGWPEREHEIFVKIYKRAQELGSRKSLKDELNQALSGTTLVESSIIDQHEQWYRSLRLCSTKRKDSTARYVTNREELIQQALIAISEARESIREERENEAKLKEHEEYRAQLHKQLCHQRKLRDIAFAEETAKAEEEAEARRALQEAEELQAQEEARVKTLLVQQYKEARRKEQEMRDAEAARLRMEYEMQLKENIEKNRPNVERREAILVEREEDKKRRMLEIQQQEQRRLELLAKLAEQVPYWENIQAATSKLDHITAAAKGQEYVKGEELTRGYIPMNGFTDRQVFKDARFRIAVALRAAGVHQSEAAKVLVAAMHSRPTPPI